MSDVGVIGQKFRDAARALESPKMGTEAVAPLLYDLVMLHRPRRILEVGGGLSTLYLLKALADSTMRGEAERGLIEQGGVEQEGSLLDPVYHNVLPRPAQLHMIDNLVHANTTAGKVIEVARSLGIDAPLRVHEADFIGYADKLPKDEPPFDMVWFDCGTIEYFQHFRRAYWPLVSRNGGLILIHSLATNFHGQMFLSELKLEQATKSFSDFELLTLIEPHKRRQNSVTMVRLTGTLHTQIHSVMP
jgi:predicted O-methyltransferase YrrM